MPRQGRTIWRSSRLLSVSIAAALTSALPIANAQPASVPPADGTPIVIGRTYTVRSTVLGDTRRVNVWLPPSYGQGEKRYPVLVLLDGGTQEDFLHIVGLAQITSAYGRGQEMIVVGVEGVNRRHDLSPRSDDPADLRYTKTPGGADGYRRFLAAELKPWIESRYRTNGRSALIGESMAGLFVLDTLASTPAAFNDYIAVSPIVWWNRQSVSRRLADRPPVTGPDRRLFVAFEGSMVAGAMGLTAAQQAEARIDTALKDAPNVKIVRFVDERHDAIYQPAALAAFRTLYAVSPDGR